ncbi:MAG TPA: potassium transporter TrkG, partial [Methanoculleus sp.]|nr:potassium transporter TrkG [Methanoculleus sp.]
MDRRRDRFFPAFSGKKVLPAANSQFAIIASDLGLIFLFIALVSCTPFLVGFWYGELDLLLPMASAPAGFGILGVWLASVAKAEGEAHLSVALSAVALIWLAAALIGALPYMFGLGIPYTDSVFEAMSGWTGTGFSLLPSVDTVPRMILFWRSLTQWMGGLGIVAFTIALAGRSGLTRFHLYRSEG